MDSQANIPETAIAGIAAVERDIIDHAASQHLQGLRLEWNEDLDFGHLMDPVPVVVITPDGRSVEEHFSLQEMAAFSSAPEAGTRDKIEHIVSALVHGTASSEVQGSRGV